MRHVPNLSSKAIILNNGSVNSVPRFENAWMQRSKFPYTARSSAKVIRHAVSIDERRAKFRSDLVSGHKSGNNRSHRHGLQHQKSTYGRKVQSKPQNEAPQRPAVKQQPDRFRRPSQQRQHSGVTGPDFRRATVDAGGHLMPGINISQGDPINGEMRSLSSKRRAEGSMAGDNVSIRTGTSVNSFITSNAPGEEEDLDEAAEQDIEELWFPGCHADLGGGWPLAADERYALSHGPLVWMVKEAEKAGLEFDADTMVALRCHHTDSLGTTSVDQPEPTIPKVQVPGAPPDLFCSSPSAQQSAGWLPGLEPAKGAEGDFHEVLRIAATKGVLHDCLQFNNGLSHSSVMSWKIMEYMPFRRMDLKPDGSWGAISFPLPMGEVRSNANVHRPPLKVIRFETFRKMRKSTAPPFAEWRRTQHIVLGT